MTCFVFSLYVLVDRLRRSKGEFANHLWLYETA